MACFRLPGPSRRAHSTAAGRASSSLALADQAERRAGASGRGPQLRAAARVRRAERRRADARLTAASGSVGRFELEPESGPCRGRGRSSRGRLARLHRRARTPAAENRRLPSPGACAARPWPDPGPSSARRFAAAPPPIRVVAAETWRSRDAGTYPDTIKNNFQSLFCDSSSTSEINKIEIATVFGKFGKNWEKLGILGIFGNFWEILVTFWNIPKIQKIMTTCQNNAAS
jgi:hypothetical protein